MSRDTEADIRRLQSLRNRVKTMEGEVSKAQARHETAESDREEAKRRARELGINADDERTFDRWLANESDDIEAILRDTEGMLSRVKAEIGE